MSEPFDVVNVDSWELSSGESSGGEEKAWLVDPEGTAWLFKPRTDHGTWAQGEDWAEKITTQLAALLEIPTAEAEFAVRNGRLGSISRSLTADTFELQHGAVLIGAALPGFVTHSRHRSGHTLEIIRTVLDGVGPPAKHPTLTSFDVFAGYLVLDALVANQDRHEENWAVLRPIAATGAVALALAGSYDHGSSLAFNLQDSKRADHLANGTVERYAGKARAQRFERATDGQLTLVELAHRALGLATTTARELWVASLVRVDDEVLHRTVDCAENLSDSARKFTEELLITNRRRLLHE